MKFRAEIDIMPLKALLDPQGKTVSQNMINVGLSDVNNVRIGKHVTLEVEATSKEEATEKIDLANKSITLNFNGEINEATKSDLVNELIGYEYLRDFSLVINGNKNRSSDKILELYDLAIYKIEERETAISTLKKEIDSLKLASASAKSIMDLNIFSSLFKDAKIQFTELRYFGYSNMLISSDFRTIDTVTVVKTQWDSSLVDSLVEVRVDSLKIWLKSELEIENLEVDW